jgi:hypothetical protein
MAELGLNSTALETLAAEMRVMNEKPTFEMNYSEYAAASGIYAMIAGLESLAQGLKAEEQRRLEIERIALQREIEYLKKYPEHGSFY